MLCPQNTSFWPALYLPSSGSLSSSPFSMSPIFRLHSTSSRRGRLSRQALLTATLLLAAVLFAVIPLQMPLEPWLLLILLILLTATILTTIIDAIACDVAFGCPAKAFMTAYSFAIDIGAALGPLIGYALNDIVGPHAIYWAFACGLSLLAVKWFAWAK